MNKFLVSVLLGIALPATCQEGRVVVLTPVPPVSSTRFEKGEIEGRTYKNASVGLELTPAAKLKLGTPELKVGRNTGFGSFVTVAAWGEEKLLSARDGTIFWAAALTNYPETLRSTEARVQSVVEDNRKAGFELLGRSEQAQLGVVAFVRTDFKKGAAHEAIFVKACKTEELVFIFFGADRQAADKMVAATELKLTPVSGCGSTVAGVERK